MIKILLAGEGGQGIQTVAKIITLATQKSGLKTSYIPSFGVEQRGGVSLGYVQISETDIPYPRFEKADIVVAFCDRAIVVIEKYLTDKTIFIYDNSAIHDRILDQIKPRINKYLGIPAQKLAQEKYSTKVLNMIMLGALASQIPGIDINLTESSMLETLGDKIAANSQLKEMNANAMREGYQVAEAFDISENQFVGIETKNIEKEFSDSKKTWTRFPEYCKGCALCIVRCPVNAIKFSDEVGFLGNPLPIVDIDKCITCGMCEKTCPDGAIRLEKKDQ